VIFADKPSQADWLTPTEQRVVLGDLEADNREAGPRQHGLVRALITPQLWLLTVIQFCLTSANPTVVASIGIFANARSSHSLRWHSLRSDL
jgi:hypothetical protein